MQFAKRSWWSDAEGVFVDAMSAEMSARGAEWFSANCEAARVFIRLAALHAEQDYRHAAVLAPGADYHADAARVLTAIAPRYRDFGGAAAVYALALGEWMIG